MSQTENAANATAEVNPLVLALAAEVYAARQKRLTNPTGYFNGRRFYLSAEEYAVVPEDVRDRVNPSEKFPYAMLNYARSKAHVSALFGLPVEALAAEVKRRNEQRRRRESKQNDN